MNGFFKKHPILSGFLKAILFCIIFFGICEITLRIHLGKLSGRNRGEGNPEFKPHPTVFWRLRPNLDMLMKMPPKTNRQFTIKTNSRGLRSDEISLRKPRNGYRILCLGDSITYGHGVDSQFTYEKQLERILQEKYPDKKVQVINGGCPGYTSFQGLYILENIGLKYDPDLLIVGFCYADPAAEMKKDSDRVEKNPILRKIKEILYESELYLLLRRVRLDEINPEGLPPDGYQLTSLRVPLPEYRRIMLKFAGIMGKQKGYVIYLSLPNAEPDPFPYYADYRAECKDVAKKTGNFYIDLDAVFDSQPNPLLLYLPSVHPDETVDRIHPNEEGFAIFAEEIARVIIENRLVEKSGKK